MKNRPLAPKGGNDNVMTPDYLATKIVGHFSPSGKILEPCSGDGAFIRAMAKYNKKCFSCEISKGTDFFQWDSKVDWIVTNPPWSQLRNFLNHSMNVSDNVVFLCLINAFFMKARIRDMQEHNFGIVEILHLPQPDKEFNWPQTGFGLGAIWIKRNWSGPINNNLSKL